MKPIEEALGSVAGLSSLRLEGSEISARVLGALTDATIERTIEGASTLSLTFHDDQRSLLNSGLFGERVTAQVDKFSFELVQVSKSGDAVTCTFEDLPVAALRRNKKPLKVAPGKFTHVEFARRLVEEEKWIKFRTPKDIKAVKSKVELSRGNPAKRKKNRKREDTWTAIGRLADERGWRRFVRGKNTIWYVPEEFLFKGEPAYTLEENTGGVDHIDFDFDVGKDASSLTVTARSGRWAVPPGTLVQAKGIGPANGKWLVKSVSRSLFDINAEITLEKPIPILPEPKPEPPPKQSGVEGADDGTGKGKVTNGAKSAKGFMWPTKGRISSRFGPRSSGYHTGLDIAAPTGTPIRASKGGTVLVAGWLGGDSYGNAIYIDHGGGVVTRYAHLSQIQCSRGEVVEQGEQIGTVGSTGNSKGPHLHFEVVIGGSPRDPLGYLP